MFERPSLFLRSLYPKALWRIKTKERVVALTFDDGPIPEVTPWILDLLRSEGIRATFFMVGENIGKHPDIFQRVLNEGHRIGNHTDNHLKAFFNNKEYYFSNINKSLERCDTDLFRPPYGQLFPWYLSRLKRQFKKVVFWDVLSRDYDQSLSGNQVLENVLKNVRPGSIVVFHDNIKAFDNLKFALPLTIKQLKAQGYKFDTL